MDKDDVMLEQNVAEQDMDDAIQTQLSAQTILSQWEKVQMGELGAISGGSTPSTKVPEYWGGKIPWLTPSEVTRQEGLYISQTERSLTKEGLANCSAKLLPVGAVMMTSRATIGEVVINSVPMVTNQGFINISCGEGVFNEFLAYWIKQSKHRIESYANGVTFREISKSNFKAISIFLPPISQQRTIAKVLQIVQEAIQARRDELKLERERKAALMEYLFTHGIRSESLKQTSIGEMPQGWQVVRLEEVFMTQLGKMLSPKAKIGKLPKPYMRNANVQWGYVDCSEVFEMDFDERESNKFRLEYGDILVCEGGEVGRTAIWRNELPECYFQKAIHRLRPRRDQMIPTFFLYHMERAFLYENIYGIAGTETTIAHLPQEKLVSMFIPKPSLDEQQVIAQILEACDTCILTLRREITLLDELFRALLEELMTGRLSTLPLIEGGGSYD